MTSLLIAIEQILSPAELAAIRSAAAEMPFGDGKASAGRYAREVKANDQAAPSDALEAIRARVGSALAAHPVFHSAARPKALTPLILSRYRAGQTYGFHVDDAMMGGLRTDLSFTLFLSEPESYDGGALVIEDTFEPRGIKLAAGSLILYPSTALHRVDPVSRGERLAIVGWVQSLVRDAGQREILFDLDRSIASLHARDGKSEVFDLLTKSRSNLIRMWSET